ncbi:MAG: AAA family ATPase, partial [Proteobacteria bacterium]|nr:AAA family ATPase [Pseudomonadota bacterium]
MKKLSIILNERFKSFVEGFKAELQGGLIILSGVNGSGKSQLIEIISQIVERDKNKKINATVSLDGEMLDRIYIEKRSFKDNISILRVPRMGIESVKADWDAAWEKYNNNKLLRLDHPDNEEFRSSCEKLKSHLIEQFDSRWESLERDEFINAIPADFIWARDDIFSNRIWGIFSTYLVREYAANAEAGKTGNKYERSILEVPPWEQLNKLFEELGFSYRFEADFEIVNFELNKQPGLFEIDSNGKLLLDQPRKLGELSDGEKAIISLVFASLSEADSNTKKVLLLDEYDAVLNPSLTNALFKVLNKYFVSKGIVVIMTTHNPATIGLAPEYASFYEVFRVNDSKNRIMRVQKYEYDELKVANEHFYAEMQDQKARICELEKAQDELIVLSKSTKPNLFVEGIQDVNYIRKAADHYPNWKLILDRFDLTEKNGAGNLVKYWTNRNEIIEFLHHPLVLLFDCDTQKSNDDYKIIHKRCIPANPNNSVKRGIENLFSDNLILEASNNVGAEALKRTIPDAKHMDIQEWALINNQKTALCDWICEKDTKEDFDGFSVIFD